MQKLLVACVVVGGVALLGACPAKGPAGGGTTATGTGPTAKSAPLGDTMADATLYHQGSLIQAALGCNTSGYAKFDFPVGQAVKMDVSVEGPEGTCVSAHYLKANGGAVDGMMKELCVGKNGSETWDVQGLEGGSFLQVSEAPPCKNASIKVNVQ
jgi:hypothetical protein